MGKLGKWLKKTIWTPLVEKPLKWINKEIVQPVLKKVGNTVKAILKDPLPFIAQMVGQYFMIPPYVTSAAITAMRGGSLKDIATNAAVAYVASKTFGETSYGQTIGNQAASAGDFTASLARDFNLSTTTQTIIGNATQSGVTSAALGGIRAVLTGQNVGDAITSGFTEGAVYSGTKSYFSDINTQKDWGITPETAKQLTGLTSSALNAVVSGSDPINAVSNYVTFATLQTAKSEVGKRAESAWNEVKGWAQKANESRAEFESKQSEFNTVKTQYDQSRADLDGKIAVYDQTKEEYNKAVADAEAKVSAFNAERDRYLQNTDAPIKAYQTNVAEYNKQKAIYDDPNQSVDARNAAADKMEAYATEINKNVETINSYSSLNDSLVEKSKEIETLNQNINDGIGKKLQTATEEARASNESFVKIAEVAKAKYDELNGVAETAKKNIQQYEKTAEEAKAAEEQVQKQVAEVATREALVDAVNNGTIKTVDNPDAPAGSVTLENGMVITADGKYLQDGKELFANAYGIEQKGLDFKTDTGEHFVFDSTGKRLTSETDAQKAFEDQFGIKLDAEEAKKFAGSQYGQEDTAAMKAVADAKIAEQLKQYGYKADQATIDSLIEKGGDTLANVEKAVDPYYVAEDEVNQFFQQTLGRDATPEEVIKFIGTKEESATLGEQQAAELKKFDLLQNLFNAAESKAETQNQPLTASQYDFLHNTMAGGDDSAFVDVAGYPIYADSPKAQDVEVPQGYRVASIDEANNQGKTGAFYDYNSNAWIVPDAPTELLQDTTAGYFPTADPLTKDPSLANTTVTGKSENFSDGYDSMLWDYLTSLTKSSGTGGAGVSGAGGTGGTGGAGAGGVGEPSPSEMPSLSEVTVKASPEIDEPLLDLPTGTVTPRPVANVTATTPAPTTTTTTTSAQPTSGFSGLPALGAFNSDLLPGSATALSPLKATFLTATEQAPKWQDILSPLHQVMAKSQQFELPQDQSQQQTQLPQIQEQPDMLEPFYKYGTNQSIDDIMSAGQDQPQMAAGGLTGTRHGRYAGNDMATPLMAAGGKMRVDFRHGDAVTGEGDGQSDDIPAMLADGEFVFPADVVAAIGNGSTKAGSDKLYDMMHGIRAHVRSAKPQDLPPEIKSPLHFLNAKPKKARR